MKKGMTITLTVLVVLGLALGVTAATTTHTFFNVTDPDITISAFTTHSQNGEWESVAEFTLSGTGTASGNILTSTDQYTMPWQRMTGEPAQPANTTSYPNLYGYYNATGKTASEYVPGDFESKYTADTWRQESWKATRYLSQHSLDVTGIPEGSTLGVIGDATASSYPGSGFAAGQLFGNELVGAEGAGFAQADKAIVEARRQVYSYSSADWENPTGWSGAYLNATAEGSSTVEFGGYTEGRYFQTTHRLTIAVPEMADGGTGTPYGKGFGFDIAIDGSSLSSTFKSSYSYQKTVTETKRIRGEAGTFNPGWVWQAWTDYPGAYPIYGDPFDTVPVP